MNRAQVRQNVARNVEGRNFVVGTITSMNVNNPRCDSLAYFPNDNFNDSEFFVYAGTAIGQSRRVSDFLQLNGEVVPLSAFAPNAVAGDSFEIHPHFGWTVEQFNAAIDMAHYAVEDIYLLDKVDESLTMIVDTYEYTIPAGFRYLSKVLYKPIGATYFTEISVLEWRVIPGATKKLWLDRIYDGATLRLVGQGQATLPANDAATVQLPERYVVAKATALVLAMQPGGEISDARERMQWAAWWEQQADIEMVRMRTAVKPNSRIVESN